MRVLTALSGKIYRYAQEVTPAEVSLASWYKSSFSNLNGSCVEVSRLMPGHIGVRDTKDNGTGPILVFTDSEWSAFIAGAKDGQFDDP